MPRNTTQAYPDISVREGAIPHGRPLEFSGIHPDADAGYNRLAIQQALDLGGALTLYTPGVYPLDADSFTVPEGAELVLGPGVAFSISGEVRTPQTLLPSLMRRPGRFGPPLSAYLFGDSLASYAEVTTALTTAVDNGDGTGSFSISGGHGAWVGAPCRFTAMADAALCAMDGVVTAVASSTAFTASLGTRKHTVTGAGPGSVSWPKRRSGRGWISQFETQLGYPVDWVWCAVGGANSAEVLDLARNSKTERRALAVVSCFMNDIYSEGWDLAACKTAALNLLIHALTVADHVIVTDVGPRDSGGGAWSSGKQAVHNALNHWLWKAAGEYGYEFVQTGDIVINGATATNSAATNPDPIAAASFDGTHDSFPMAVGKGKRVADIVAKRLQLVRYRPVHSGHLGADIGNILADPTFNNAGTLPTGWSLTNVTTNATFTSSLVARTVATDGDALGKNLVLSFDKGTATGQCSGRAALSSSVHALLTVGKKFRAMVPFKASGLLDLQGLDVTWQGTIGATGQTWQVVANAVDSNADGWSGSYEGVLMTPEAVIPAGITACTPFVRVTWGQGQVSGGSVIIAQPQYLVYD